MSLKLYSCACSCDGVFESKLLAVQKPWGFYEPWINASTSIYRYEVWTILNTNPSGSRTTVNTYDHDNGESDTSTTDTSGFDPSQSSGGTEVSHVITETVDSLVYPLWSIVNTLSTAVTLATVTGEAQTVLDAWIDTWDMEAPFVVSGYVGGVLSDVVVAFPGELVAFPAGLPTADHGYDMALISPSTGMFPWDGTYEVIQVDSGLRNYYYAQYGWSADISLGPLYALGSLSPAGGSESNYANWKLAHGFAVCTKSCYKLPSGTGCSSGGVGALVPSTGSPASQLVTSSTCSGIELAAGVYCFSKDGIYESGNSTQIADSYSVITDPAFMFATDDGNGHGSFFLNQYGPLPWTLTCC